MITTIDATTIALFPLGEKYWGDCSARTYPDQSRKNWCDGMMVLPPNDGSKHATAVEFPDNTTTKCPRLPGMEACAISGKCASQNSDGVSLNGTRVKPNWPATTRSSSSEDPSGEGLSAA